MNNSFLPPRGMFIPTHIIFNTQLPSAAVLTWIQLRCLAWRGWTTPPLSLPELASLIGIHPARLQQHLAALQDISSLTCRSAGNGKLILTFPEEPTTRSEPSAPTNQDHSTAYLHTHREGTPETASYFPDRILGYISYQEEEESIEITDDIEKINQELEKVESCH